MKTYDYLMIGNSAAAISAVEAIRSVDDKGTIAVVSNEDFPAYSTPMISYLLKGKITEEKMPIRSESFYDDNAVECIFGEPATAIYPKLHTVSVGSEQFGYKKLLMACGNKPADPPVEGLDGENVFSFINLTDARAIMSYVDGIRAQNPDAPVNAVVIGSGLIGCKACEGLAHICDNVTMLARSASILRSIIDPKASPIAEKALQDGGVEVRLLTQAVGFEKDGNKVAKLQLNDGSTIECDLLILAAGVVPNIDMAVNAGAEAKRGLICDTHMKTSLEDVYAAGDLTVTHDTANDSDRIIALWPNAVVQGKIAGLNMAGKVTEFNGNFAMNSITLFGITILTAGAKSAGEGMEEQCTEEDGKFTKFVTCDGKLKGFTLVNHPENAGIYTRMIEDEIDLADVRPEAFERAPEMIDLPAKISWKSLHEGMPSATPQKAGR